MATLVKITQIGNSVGIILPKEVLWRLIKSRKRRQSLHYCHNSCEGVPTHSAVIVDFADEMQAAKRVMKKHRDALHKLAQ